MRKKRIIHTLAIIALLWGCKKEITLPYRDIDPMPVITAQICQYKDTEIYISRSTNMTDSDTPPVVRDASVWIVDTLGNTTTFELDVDSYKTQAIITPQEGMKYTLNVEIDNTRYQSYATVYPVPQISAAYIAKIAFGEEHNIMVAGLNIIDTPGESNYYCYHLLIDGVEDSFGVVGDNNIDGTMIPVYMALPSYSTDPATLDSDRDYLYGGEEISVVVEEIDSHLFDYLSSLLYSNSTSSNPISNFSGGALGYFSICRSATSSTVFSYEDVFSVL